MPSRAPSCRHVARSLSTQSLWITDEVLDNAFNRFLSVSRTAKRYGSSVPGPMEAQRRLAKRRMAGLTSMGGPAAFDVGLLFGSGPPTREELNWYAPMEKEDRRLPQEIETPSTIIETWTSIMHRLQIHEAQRARDEKVRKYLAQSNPPKVMPKGQLPFDTRLRGLHTLDETRTLAQQARDLDLMNPAEFSRRAYKQLLANRAPDTALLEYLKDPTLNLPQVHNVMRFVSDRKIKGILISRDFYVTLSQLLSLGMVQPNEFLEVLDALPRLDLATIQKIWSAMKACRVVPDWSHCARKLLLRLDTGNVLEGSGNLMVELYQHAFPMSHSWTAETPDLGHHLAYWVKCVHDQLSSRAESIERLTLIRILAVIGRLKKQKHQLLAATASLLQHKPADDSKLSQWHSLISSWLSLLLEAKASAARTHARDPRQLDQFFEMISEHLTPRNLVTFFESQPVAFSASVIAQAWLPRLFPAIWSVADSVAIQRDLRLIPNTDLRSSVCTRPTDNFADIIIALARRGFEYETAMTTIAEFCHNLYGIDGVFWLVKTWRYAQVRIIPEALGSILRNLARVDARAALALYTRARLWIGSSPELLPNLITKGASAHKIMTLLDHKDPTNSLSLHLREKPKNTLHHTRNTLLHVVADAFSRSHRVCRLTDGRKSKKLRNRQVFRNVYRAYRYLVTRQSPVRPLMARALVRAAIIRPLEQFEWVNTSRVKFILGIVRRVEGERVADELDKRIYLWRGKLHRYLMCKDAYLRRNSIDPGMERDRREELRRQSREGRARRRRRAFFPALINVETDSMDSLANGFSNSSQFEATLDDIMDPREKDACASYEASAIRVQDSLSSAPGSAIDKSSAATSREKTIDGSADLRLSPHIPVAPTIHRVPSAYCIGSPRGGIRKDLKGHNLAEGGMLRYQFIDRPEEMAIAENNGRTSNALIRSMTTRGELAVQARYRRSKDGLLVKVDGCFQR
ncbi:hypothetical protein FKW77_004875 [Venturia effusa]|uniref:Uncharacterized protein n=1 Tax=Venturia effusa TaxID=50376 RepID=A0A517L7A6_9PEZI|nr:hypothetical protein FKW77_004875 [Venturia effusa]